MDQPPWAIISSGAINLTPDELAPYDLVVIVTDGPQVTMTTLGELTIFLERIGTLSLLLSPADFSFFDFSPDLHTTDIYFLVISQMGRDGWPTSPAVLPTGSLWVNQIGNVGYVSAVVSGVFVPGPPVFFGNITARELLANGTQGMPIGDPEVENEMWLDGPFVCVSILP